MVGFALAAAAASNPAWAALWISVGALAVSIVTVLVTVVLWRRDGWRVSVAVGRNYSRDGETTICAYITNVGRMPCVIRDISIRRGAPKGSRISGNRLRLLTVDLNDGKLPKTLAPTERVTAVLGGRDVLRSGWFRVVVTSGNRLYRSAWTDPSEVGIPTQSAIRARRPGMVRWRR
jgi:hypothetical protein